MRLLNTIKYLMSIKFSVRFFCWAFIIFSTLVYLDIDAKLYTLLNINHPSFIDNELIPYYNRFREFEYIAGREVSYRNIYIIISDGFTADDDTAAYCEYYGHFDRKIVVNRKYFSKASHAEREVLFIHEALHCFYKEEHRLHSIMESRVLFDKYYIAHYDYFIKEAFGIESSILKFEYQPYPEEGKENKEVNNDQKCTSSASAALNAVFGESLEQLNPCNYSK